MKKILILMLLPGIWQLAASNLSGFKDLTDLTSAPPILSEGFTGSANGWILPDGWSYTPKEGLTGSGGLKYVRTDPKNNKEAMFYINVKPGIRYKLSLRYRSELKVDPKRERMEIFAIRYWDENGKKCPGNFYSKKKMNSDNNDWEIMEFVFRPPAGMKKSALCLLMRIGRTGTLWFDDIVITQFSSDIAMLHMIAPQKLTLNEQGDISWQCYAPTLDKKIKLAIQATVGGRTKRIPVNADGKAKGSFGKFATGRVPVEAKLLDLTNKRIIAVDRGNVFVRLKKSYAAPHNVEIDQYNRVLVGGKPFMPIGLFAGMIVERKDIGALKKIQDAGFNTILANGYTSPYGGIKKSPEKTLSAMCNVLHKHNLKFIFSIKHQIEIPKNRKRRGRYQWGPYKSKNQIVNMTVKTLRNHPAMLAWYVSDENSIDEIPAIRALRERISQYDPYHPVLTLTNLVRNFQYFAKTGDVLLYDLYPIGWRKNSGPAQTLKDALPAFAPAKQTGLPLWWVPQAFPWAASSLENLPRYPTEAEMTSQCLLAAIHGVKAFLLYSWHHATYLADKNAPGHSQKLWQDICKTVGVLKELEPFIMSTETAPAIKVKKVKGKDVKAAAFKSGDKLRVLIVAIGPGDSSAEITVPGRVGLKSRTGKTEDLGGGCYRFTGKHIVYDILN